MAEPKDATEFLGVVDFYGVLLPGALLAWLIADQAWTQTLLCKFHRFEGETARLLFFAVVALLLGRVVSAIGAFLDWVYDRTFRRIGSEDLDRLRDAVYPSLRRTLGDPVFDADRSPMRWASCLLALKAPEVSRRLDAMEANSKFYRSLTIVLLVALGIFIRNAALAVGMATALIFAGWQYVSLRKKFTAYTYRYALVAMNTKAASEL